MKKLLIYTIYLIVLPSITIAEKLRIQPEDFVQFRTIAHKQSFKNNFMQKNQFAHEKKTFAWDRFAMNWNISIRTEYEFSVEGLIKSETNYDAQNQAFSKYLRKYDKQNRLVFQEEYVWNTNNWQATSTDEFQYDKHGRELLTERKIWNNNQWEIQFGIKYQYDSISPEKLEQTQYIFDHTISNYIPNNKEIIEKENNRIVARYFQVWNDMKWQNETAEAYDFDDNGIMSSVYTFVWNNDSWQNYELMYHIEWENYAEQLPARYNSRLWMGSTWSNEYKTEYTYTRNGGLIATESILDDFEWRNLHRFVDEFDSNKNRSVLKFESFENNHWIVQFENQYLHTYDSQQRLIETITKMFDGIDWTNVMKEEYGEYKVGTGIFNAKKLNVQVFPNPFIEYIHFNVDEKSGNAHLSVLDLNGRMLMEQDIELGANNTIQVAELVHGTYILRVEVEGKVYTEKIVKKGE